MKDKILVKVKGTQLLSEAAGPDAPIEIFVPGTYRFNDGTHIIEYDESSDEMPGTIHNVIVLGDGKAEVRKSGTIEVDMYFEKEKTNLAYYVTPFGTIELTISTLDVQIQEEDDRIELTIRYSLSVNESLVADCRLQLQAVSSGMNPECSFK